MHWRRKWQQPTPVFLPGESQGRGSLVGCRLCGHTESDMTEVSDLVSCADDAVELSNAYAYDCNSAYWVTEGDGDFEDNTFVNTL